MNKLYWEVNKNYIAFWLNDLIYLKGMNKFEDGFIFKDLIGENETKLITILEFL